MSTKMIVLKSSDGQSFGVEEKIAIQSQTIAHMVEDDCAITEIPLPNVTSKALALVIEYFKNWDKQLMETADKSTIFDLVVAANYLNMKSLHDLACQAVANMIIGKTPEEIRVHFNIENDFTPEEEEANRRDNPWAFE